MSLKEKLSELFSEDATLAEAFMRHWNSADLPDTCEFMSVSHEQVDTYGGEDCGSTYYSVHKFTLNNEVVFIKFNGWYASHYGSEYRNFKFVTPQQRTLTVYE